MARYAGEHVHKRLLGEPNYKKKDYPAALKDAFLNTDADMKAGTCTFYAPAGSIKHYFASWTSPTRTCDVGSPPWKRPDIASSCCQPGRVLRCHCASAEPVYLRL